MVRIGVVGTGGIACNVHIPEILKCPEGKLVAICDIDEEKLRAAGEKFNIPENMRFKNYMDLINCPEVDAVEVCTPNHLHVPIALAAVKAGKHVEVEKPLTTESNPEMAELLSEIEKRGVVNMMSFSYRFKSAVRYAKHLIDEGRLGKIVNVNIEYLQSGVFIPGRRLEWRFVKEFAGSGTLGDLGVHLIDMTRFLLGDFKSVAALSATVVKERRKLDSEEIAPVLVDDITSFVAKLENDVIANFLVTKCAIGESNTIKYEIYGTEGVLKFNLNNPDVLSLCIGDVDRETGSLHEVNVPVKYRLGQEECFIKTIAGQSFPYYPAVSEGAICQGIVDAVLRSANEGVIVKL